MSTVYVKNITAFDATKDQTIMFGYTGNQCIKNRIIIYNSATNASVYDNTVTTYTLAHTISAGTLVNGISYYCTITAYYLENNTEKNITSSKSNIFKCLSSPIWGFDELADGSTIGNSYYTFRMLYSQAQNETVNEYYIAIYDTSGNVYWESDALYDVSALTTVTGLPNGSVFKVRAYGTTTGGMTIDTRSFNGADISVTVDYTSPTLYSLVEVENNKWAGWVKASNNFMSVEGTPSNGIVYINDKCVDLSSSESSITFNSGFKFGDGTIELRVYSGTLNSTILNLAGDNLNIILSFRQVTFDSGEKFYAELTIPASGYILNSNMITPPASTDIIFVWIQRKSGLLNLKIENKGALT